MDDCFTELLVKPLKACKVPERGNMIFIVDALDEIGVNDSKERRDVLDLLKKLLFSLPDWVKVVVTSRP